MTTDTTPARTFTIRRAVPALGLWSGGVVHRCIFAGMKPKKYRLGAGNRPSSLLVLDRSGRHVLCTSTSLSPSLKVRNQWPHQARQRPPISRLLSSMKRRRAWLQFPLRARTAAPAQMGPPSWQTSISKAVRSRRSRNMRLALMGKSIRPRGMRLSAATLPVELWRHWFCHLRPQSESAIGSQVKDDLPWRTAERTRQNDGASYSGAPGRNGSNGPQLVEARSGGVWTDRPEGSAHHNRVRQRSIVGRSSSCRAWRR